MEPPAAAVVPNGAKIGADDSSAAMVGGGSRDCVLGLHLVFGTGPKLLALKALLGLSTGSYMSLSLKMPMQTLP